MNQNDLKPNVGARKTKIRRGRGDASGYGSFSGRGCKGQNARAGGGVRLGFEGGQSTMIQRMPKLKGFKNPSRVETIAVNLDRLDEKFLDGESVNLETLKEKGLIQSTRVAVKILGRGEISKKLHISEVYLSETAQEKLKKAGATIA
ncbi:MAG: 50S ribosomal protein L15 [Candidatus Peregrinibacteria bacterium]